MNEVEYNVSFLHINNGTETLLSTTGWIQQSAGKYCISLRKIKVNSNLFPGGFIAGHSYKVVLNVKNDCDIEATKTMVFTLPDKNCQDTPIIILESYPNPANDFTRLKITAQDSVNNALLLVSNPIYGSLVYNNLGALTSGITEIDLDIYSWPHGLNFIHIVTENKVHSCTIYKN